MLTPPSDRQAIWIKHKGATLWIKRKLNGFARGNIAKEHIRDAKQGSKVSIGALQGYLLRYKDDPAQAALYAAEWPTSESIEEWHQRASSLITIQDDSASVHLKNKKKKRKTDEEAPKSKAVRVAEDEHKHGEDVASVAKGQSRVDGDRNGE